MTRARGSACSPRSRARSRSRSSATRSGAAPRAGSRRSPSSPPSAGRSSRSSPSLGEGEEERSHLTTAWTWLSTGSFDVGLTLLVDPLSVTMMLIVSGVGGLIVLYSVGYMDGDDEERRYFAYMSLFVFAMLMLVQGGNFLLLLVGWGLVGLASYLLIGFWHERPEAIAAAKKAFVMNAFGDATMALAFFVLIWQTGLARLRGGLRRRRGDVLDGAQPGRARPARRRRGQVGADPAAHLAPGRDGGPDARLGADPRGDDGDRGRLPRRARTSALRAGADDPGSRRGARRGHARRRRPDRARPDRHQARDRVLDDVADRLHVRRRRPRRVRQRDVPSDDARLLQGAALHGRRARDPPPRRRAGHPPHGRPAPRDAARPGSRSSSARSRSSGSRRCRASSPRTRSSPLHWRAGATGSCCSSPASSGRC